MLNKIGASGILMDLLILHTKDLNFEFKDETALFVNDILLALATCLRLDTTSNK